MAKTYRVGQWQAGQSGNPNGRPLGSRGKSALVLDRMADGASENVLQVVVDAALAGDMTAAGLILRRVWPERKGAPLAWQMPTIETPADLPIAMTALTQALADGELSPAEAASCCVILEAHRRSLELDNLEVRLQALEQSNRPQQSRRLFTVSQ